MGELRWTRLPELGWTSLPELSPDPVRHEVDQLGRTQVDFIPRSVTLDAMQRELSLYKRWFERHRPHQGLDGRTPLEVADGANQGRPAIDPKQPIELIVHFHAGRKELPMVSRKNVT